MKTAYKDEWNKNKLHVNIISTISLVPTDILNGPNNTNDEICGAIIVETLLKLVYHLKME